MEIACNEVDEVDLALSKMKERRRATNSVHNQKMNIIEQYRLRNKYAKNGLAGLRFGEAGLIKRKQWVRLQQGPYQHDIAQLEDLDFAQNKVHLKLLPRIDYTKLRGASRTTPSEPEVEKRKKKPKPPRKPFDPEAIRAIGGEITSDGDFLMFEGNRYSRKGFLYKNYPLSDVFLTEPTLAELERFGEQDLELPAEEDGMAVTHTFGAGDNVEVCEGELISVQGKIITTNGNMITMMPEHDFKIVLLFRACELRKYVKVSTA